MEVGMRKKQTKLHSDVVRDVHEVVRKYRFRLVNVVQIKGDMWSDHRWNSVVPQWEIPMVACANAFSGGGDFILPGACT